MLATILAKVLTSLATKIIEFIITFIFNSFGDIQDANEIDEAMEDEDPQRGARRLNDVFR